MLLVLRAIIFIFEYVSVLKKRFYSPISSLAITRDDVIEHYADAHRIRVEVYLQNIHLKILTYVESLTLSCLFQIV
jgi:hypothetical protein